MSKRYFFRRKEDGAVIVYDDRYPKEKKQVEYLLKRPGFELMTTVDSGISNPDRVVKDVPIIEDTLECPICGSVRKNEADLKEHRKDHR